MTPISQQSESYIVFGGAGFLGSYIVQALLSRGESLVSAFDLKEPAEGDKDPRAKYYAGNICDSASVLDVLKIVCFLNNFSTSGGP